MAQISPGIRPLHVVGNFHTATHLQTPRTFALCCLNIAIDTGLMFLSGCGGGDDAVWTTPAVPVDLRRVDTSGPYPMAMLETGFNAQKSNGNPGLHLHWMQPRVDA